MPRKGENIYKRKDGRWEAPLCKGMHNGGKNRIRVLLWEDLPRGESKGNRGEGSFGTEPSAHRRRYPQMLFQLLR